VKLQGISHFIALDWPNRDVSQHLKAQTDRSERVFEEQPRLSGFEKHISAPRI
jgi:hypothetical protein